MTAAREPTTVMTVTRDRRTAPALAGLVPAGDIVVRDRAVWPSGGGVVVVDGGEALRNVDAADAAAWVERGGRLVVVGAPPADDRWTEVTGVGPQNTLPAAEYVLSPDGDPLTVRVDEEFPVVGVLSPLDIRDARVLLETTVGTRRRSVVAHRRLGRGTVTVVGVQADLGALSSPPLRAVVGRAVSERSTDRPSATLGVGVVGYGRYGSMGHRHGAASEATPGLRLAAVAESDPRRRAAAAAAFPAAAVHADLGAMLADDTVDVVVVATPPVSHADHARQALHAGRHVVVEKPLCLTVGEADELLDLAGAGRRVLTVHQNRRWDPDFLAVQRVAAQGLLGEVFNVETFVGGYEHPCRAWHSDVAVSGGAVYDWGAHHFDWMLLLLGGFPRTVQTVAHKRVWHDVTNADQLRVRLRWQDGREAEFVDSTLAAVRRPKFYVQGTSGTLVGRYRPLRDERVDPVDGYVLTEHHHAEAPAELTLVRHEPGLGMSETRVPLPPPPRHAFHRNLADHLLLGEPLAVTAAHARQLVALLEAAHRSGREGGRELTVQPPRADTG